MKKLSAIGNSGGFDPESKEITKTADDAAVISELAKDLDESRHPRDADVRFTDGSAPGSASGLTPEFKTWFGASKAAYSDGMPMVMYHGSNRSFDVFEHRAALRNTEGGPTEVVSPLFFFSPDKGTAEIYAADKKLVAERLKGIDGGTPLVRAFHLKTENPFDMTITGAVRDRMTQDGFSEACNPLAPSPYAVQALADILGYEPDHWDAIHQALDDPAVAAELRSLGYDGVRVLEHNGGEAWAVFDPEQIKLVENKTADIDIDVPGSEYQEDTWKVESIQDESGKKLDISP